MAEPDQLKPPSFSAAELLNDDDRDLRNLSRSPHPYHRHNSELLEPSDQLHYRSATTSTLPSDPEVPRERRPRQLAWESNPPSDSGTDADDEHFLKGLPAPKTKLHKGLRGRNEALSGSSTPLATPAGVEDEGRRGILALRRDAFEHDKRAVVESKRRRKEIIRRCAELLLLVCQGGLVLSDVDARQLVQQYWKELAATWLVVPALAVIYPARVVAWEYLRGTPLKALPLAIPSSFDPAPVLYPPSIPVLVATLVASNVPSVFLPNLVLSVCSLPASLVPTVFNGQVYNLFHWLLSYIPLAVFTTSNKSSAVLLVDLERLTLYYPLHQTLCGILSDLTTTSLLPAELQLLAVALINILELAKSPQILILRGLLWIGGLGMLVSCSWVIKQGITLARVPKWRFRRESTAPRRLSPFRLLMSFAFPRRVHRALTASDTEVSGTEGGSSDANSDSHLMKSHTQFDDIYRIASMAVADMDDRLAGVTKNGLTGSSQGLPKSSGRRHTLPSVARSDAPKTHTPSGRKKRSASSTVRPFFALTQQQATLRKWLYACYVYMCIVVIILVFIRTYVQSHVLAGAEPIGWALGYLFGDIQWFRFQVVMENLGSWICLPTLGGDKHAESCHMGWVQHLRHASFGEANTRLLLSGYFFAVIVMGLAVVFQLSPIYEVDTRRKVFHFMMVAMFLPSVYIDPTYMALALSLMLAVFLLLDLLRASQLPPLSKPIATFLTPYVDGRDLRGPVVISHIFLLIGCAIPLWLSLAALPRIGSGCLAGWEVPSRDVSMVAGIVCVGLGDAAASLIGRRWGHRKWIWGGGKSLEGSVAFGVAAFGGLMAASVWQKVGGWSASSDAVESMSLWSLWYWATAVQKGGICASMASLTEAVLTGGNDNVVVPVVLWTCVKSVGM